MFKFIKQEAKRYFVYLIRWQLSTPILAPIVAFFKHSSSVFGTKEDWIAATIANLIGGLIFYWVDRFIFKSKALSPVWEVRKNAQCADCQKFCRGYRLALAKDYDRTQDPNPQFRCENCSDKKLEELRAKGVNI
jgi:hypothetical protein